MTTASRLYDRWRLALAVWAVVAVACATPDAGQVDLLITGGRVMDPESGLDAILNVAVRDGEIVAVDEETPDAVEVVDASGLVVAPGFIDLHAHGQDRQSAQYQARDGVTTAMELEIGVYPVDAWYAARDGRALINYGASVSHQGARREAFGAVVAQASGGGTFTLGRGGASDAYLYAAASEDQLHPGGEPSRALAVVRDGGRAAGSCIHPPSFLGRVSGRRRDCPVSRSDRERCHHWRLTAHRAHEQQCRESSEGCA